LTTTEDISFMRQCLALATRAGSAGEVPVGALVVHENSVIAEAYNERETLASALAHAELTAVARACERLGRWRLTGCTLYVTLEPCVMCAGALVQARIDRVVYGCRDPKGGAVESLYQVLADPRLNHRPQVTAGALADECGALLTDFFRQRRKG
jgi:tRNA(adenine34) deaminase